MYPRTGYSTENLYGYGQTSSYYPAKASAPGGKTLKIIAGLSALMIIVGMALGLGLGIGAAGIISDLDLVVVSNSSSSTTK
mgnify:CR=1 FL=1